MKNILVFALDDLDINRQKEFSTNYGFPTTGLHIAGCFSVWGAPKGFHIQLFFVDYEIKKFCGNPKTQNDVFDACKSLINRVIQNFSPVLIAIAAPYTRLAFWSDFIARECRKHSHALIITGGAHASYMAKEIFKESECPYDAIILGHGESKIKHILDNLGDLDSVFSFPGIATSKKPNMEFGSPSVPFEEVPTTDYSLLPEKVVSNSGIVLMAGRGCRFRCNFCIESVYWSDSTGFYPENRTRDELKILFTKFNNPAVGLGDSTINMKDPNFETFCEKTLKNGEYFGDDFFMFTNPNLLDKDKCRIFYDHGGRSIWVGIESGSKIIQNNMGKLVDLNTIDFQLQQAKKAGIKVGAFFIFGYPGETKDTANETLLLIKRLHDGQLIDYLDPAIFVPYPGLLMYSEPDKFGLKIHETWYNWQNWNRYHTLPVYDLNTLSRAEIHKYWQEAFELKKEMDIRDNSLLVKK